MQPLTVRARTRSSGRRFVVQGRPAPRGSARRLRALLFHAACLYALAAPLSGAAQVAPVQDAGATVGDLVVFAVRHAERAEDGTSDPPLSSAGEARARLLARILADADLTAVHTTDYRRTRSTVAALASAAGLQVSAYDADNLANLAETLRSRGGRHVVVGHSNTTGAFVEALGGDGHGPIDEMEYDRLYVVTVASDRTTTVLLRFGDPFAP